MNDAVEQILQSAREQAGNDTADLILALDQLAEQAPDQVDVYLARGMFYRQRSAWNLACDEFGYAAELAPEDARAWRALGDCEFARGAWEAAAEALSEAASLVDGHSEQWARVGDCWLALDEPGRAIAAFEEGLAFDETSGLLYLGRARATVSMDLLEDAEEDIALARSNGADHADCAELSARIALIRGEIEAAIALLDPLIGDAPDRVEALRLRGDARWELGEISDALADYEHSLKVAPDDPDTLLAVAECHLALGNLDGAVAAAEAVIKASRAEDSAGLELLARALQARGDWAAARSALEKGLRVDGADSAPLYLQRARLHLASGRPNLAWRDARWAIEDDAEYAPAYVLRGRLALELEGAAEALADLDAAVELDPLSGSAWAWRGRAKELEGDMSEAEADWAEAEALLPDHDPLRDTLNDWRRRAG